MIIGIPKEIKNHENRVSLTPDGVKQLISFNHLVLVETLAGVGSGFLDTDYLDAGATLVQTPEEIWSAEIVIKVKEPLTSEYHFLNDHLILFTYLHLAPNPQLTKALLDSGTTSLAYETIQLNNKNLPLLIPMSEIAGRLSVQTGAHFLEEKPGGKGLLLSGVPGVAKGSIVIIGGGTAGANAAQIAVGIGANVTILDINPQRLAQLENQFGTKIQTLISTPQNISKVVATADLVIGCVLIPGQTAPKLVTTDMVKNMTVGSVIIDVAIDQGGIFESIDHTTTHDEPVYIKYGVQHYAVANMPGAVPKTATNALANVTLPYILQLANLGLNASLHANEALLKGLNTYQHHLTNLDVATSQGHDYVDPLTLF
ncbi:alanine dehydrogenase [Vagococcus intermedius]|uniref:Alanine dehydrogenase n=1 Tax=Vagococcus intermedius TaxID=2991418 RepID=A0AAF0CWI3_9ENTE|nr:alanine dehydrogenase [Vagococcus intermedius]WEG74179.1 alanine dehydrogenase [Vagococcus intermedius]WEG76259.1 alanine dehydrogenase [Vagococcus intermedius]